jgi:hypothetical protein
MSVLQNQDRWWGEGDDMFFVDGESIPSIHGTGSEDYFLGAWDIGSHSFAYGLYGAPVKGEEKVGGRYSVYRFHLDSPIQNPSKPPSSTATQTTVPTIFTPSLIGINPSRTLPSPRCLL